MGGRTPPAGRARPAGRVAVVLLLVAVAAGVSAVVPNDPWHDFFDLKVYRGAVAWWLDGRPL